MRFRQMNCATFAQIQEQTLGQEWDKTLTEKYALAPTAGFITEEMYKSETENIGEFSASSVLPIAQEYALTPSFIHGYKRIQWVGAGLLREWRMFRELVRKGFSITFRDASTFACDNVAVVAEAHGISLSTVRIVHGEFCEQWEPCGDCIESGLFYAGQWFQLLSARKARKVGKMLGAFLHNPKGARPRDRRVCLVHVLPEDNPGVVYRHSKPHSLHDIIAWAEKGNGPISAQVLPKKHLYYGGPPLGRKYSVIVLRTG